VKIFENSIDLGFGEAYNRAISQIKAEYVVLLNNDTEVLNPSWLTHLLKAASERVNVAAVATKMVSMGNHRLLDSVGGAGIPYWKGGFIDIGRGETDVSQYSNGFEPFAYCGGAALIRKSAFVDAGKLDAKFFAHFDDPDLSWRLRLRGWKIGYAPGAKVAHYRGGTMGSEVTPLVLYYCNRNFLRAIIKNCGSSLSWALRNYLLYTILITLAFLIYEPRKSVLLMKGIVWNLRNLRSTCAARRVIQNRRRVSEQEILRRMYPGVTPKQTGKDVALTRIMNTLFERGGRRKFQTMIASQ
jgi:GT2 family glycosyltransferase